MRNIIIITIVVALMGSPGIAEWNLVPNNTTWATLFVSDATENLILYGAARAGLWRTTNGGLEWEPLSSRLELGHHFGALQATAADSDCDTVVARFVWPVFDSQIWQTYDRGQTWQHYTEHFANGNSGDFVQIARSNRDLWYYAGPDWLHVSTNAGVDWTEAYRFSQFGGQISGLTLDAVSDSTVFISGPYSGTNNPEGGIWKSSDRGRSWDCILPLQEQFGVTRAWINSVVSLSNGDLIALVRGTTPEPWFQGNLVVSGNDGATWERIFADFPFDFQPNEIVEAPGAPGILILIGEQRFGAYRSTDYGRSWMQCSGGFPENPAACRGLSVNRFSGAIYIPVTGWGVYGSRDHGITWQLMPQPPIGTAGHITVWEDGLCLRDNGYRIWRMDQPFEQWSEMNYPRAPDSVTMIRPLCYVNGDTVISGLWKRPNADRNYTFQIIRSFNNGQSWDHDPFLPFLPDWYFDIYQSPNGRVRWLSVNPGGDSLLATTDFGRSWFTHEMPPAFRLMAYAQQESLIAVVTAAGIPGATDIFLSNDSLERWQNIHYTGPALDFACAPVFAGADLYLRANDRTWRWSAGRWDTLGVIPEAVLFNMCIALGGDPPVLLGANSEGDFLWVSTDLGLNWTIRETELPYSGQNYSIQNIRYDRWRDRVWASAGVGVCYIEAAELATGNGPVVFRPLEHHLLDIYPNPSNARTRININLPNPAFVRLTVHNLLGRECAILHEGVQAAGRNEIYFDASAFPSGVYLCRLETNRLREVKKLVILR